MTDNIIKAAKEAGFSTIQFKGDIERIRAMHSNGSWVCCTDSVSALYAIAYRAGMERAAEICDRLQDVPATEPRHCAEDIRIEAASIGANKEGA